MGPKAITCLKIAQIEGRGEDWRAAYDAACETFGEGVILKKFEDLNHRGYMECGVSARTGWLTDKGRKALEGETRQ